MRLLLPIFEVCVVGLFVLCVTIVLHILNNCRYSAAETMMHGIILTFNYYQVSTTVFAVTAGLQILVFCILALSADFDTPVKRWMKSNCSAPVLHFLVTVLNLKYFYCSNPLERRVLTTHFFFTNGTQLNTTGFELARFVDVDLSRPRDKVSVTPAGIEHSLLTIEGVDRGILVETGPRLNEQKEMLEYMANNPAAGFVKQVEGCRGTYCPIEEYAQLLNSNDICVCRFPQTAAAWSDEREIDLFPWIGSSPGSSKLSRCCKRLLDYHFDYAEMY